ILEFDHCTFTDLAAVKARCQQLGVAAAIYSTHSNSPPDDVRFRVVMPLAQLRTPPKWRGRDFARISAALGGGLNDPQAVAESRMHYRPAAQPGAAVFAEVLEGDASTPTPCPRSRRRPSARRARR